MKTNNLIVVFFISIVLLGCSSSDDSGTQLINQNGFVFNAAFYDTPFVFVNDENTIDNNASAIAIIMANVNPFETEQSSNVDFVYMDFSGVDLQVGTVDDVLDYRFITGAQVDNEDIQGGLTLLDNTTEGLMATSESLRINALSAEEIDFTFSFTRENGQVISGGYSGSYTDISN